ncbi:MAG TPA: hypothetical protein DCO75_00115 [Fibrobacteres bacterium]|jgi:anaerobic magnesium-protoporphyrin IX monomethyl ester cyclase|nr:hypothetical protein [Fibrobacterota bacterium]
MAFNAITKSNPHAVVAIPPVCDFYFTRHRFSSLGALILCDILSENGLKVSFRNFPLQCKKGNRLSVPSGISYLEKFIIPEETGKLSYFTKYQRFGPSPEDCARDIESLHPDILFIGCFAFSYGLQAIELARAVKKILPMLPVVTGGGGPSAYPQYFIEDSAMDFVITGEAEVSVKIFLKAICNSVNYREVPNLVWKENDRIEFSPVNKSTETDEIKINISKNSTIIKSLYLSTSVTRGCNKGCRFCSNFLVHGKIFKKPDINAIKEALNKLSLDNIFPNYRTVINFEDDNLLLDPDYFFKVIDMFIEKSGEVSFSAENGIDYTLLSPDIVKRLITYGMHQFNLSLASIDPDILKRQNRPLQLDHFKKMVKLIAGYSIPVITYFICGFEDDTIETVAGNLAFLFCQPTLIGISPFYAVPGTGDFENKIFDCLPSYCCNGSSAYPWKKSLSTKTMITAFRLSRYCNLVKQKTHSREEEIILNKINGEKKLYTFIKSNKKIIPVPVENMDEELIKLFFSHCS